MSSTPSSDSSIVDPLVERFRKARTALGLPQSTVAKILGLSQKLVSDYEKGIGQPSEKIVKKLEDRVKEKLAALESSGLAPGPPIVRLEDAPVLLADQGFNRFVDQFVESWRASGSGPTDGHCEFFVFAPERLPVFALQSEQDHWSRLLRRQVNFHLFGLLDELTPGQVLDVNLTLKTIEANAVKENAGVDQLSHIYVHGIVVIPSASERTAGLYNELVDSKQPGECVVIEKLVNIQQLPPEPALQWLRAIRHGGSAPLMVCRAVTTIGRGTVDPGAVPPALFFAARRLERVSLTPGGAPATGWLFYDKYRAVELIKDIDNILPVPSNSSESQGASGI